MASSIGIRNRESVFPFFRNLARAPIPTMSGREKGNEEEYIDKNKILLWLPCSIGVDGWWASVLLESDMFHHANVLWIRVKCGIEQFPFPHTDVCHLTTDTRQSVYVFCSVDFFLEFSEFGRCSMRFVYSFTILLFYALMHITFISHSQMTIKITEN